MRLKRKNQLCLTDYMYWQFQLKQRWITSQGKQQKRWMQHDATSSHDQLHRPPIVLKIDHVTSQPAFNLELLGHKGKAMFRWKLVTHLTTFHWKKHRKHNDILAKFREKKTFRRRHNRNTMSKLGHKGLREATDDSLPQDTKILLVDLWHSCGKQAVPMSR